MSDILIKAIGFNKSVRLYGVVTTDVTNIIGDKFNYLPSSLDSMGRLLSMGAIMGGMLKGDETITIRVEGNGAIGKIIIDSDSKGNIRGYSENPNVHFENNNGTLNSTKTIGDKGNIIIIKDLKLKEPYTCYTPIINGEVATDFAYYYSVSEQIPTAISLGVLVGDDSRAICSGGYMIQLMPNTPDEVISKLEEKLKVLPPVSEMLNSDIDMYDILKNITDDIEILSTTPINFKCNCSKEKFARGLISLGKDELKDIIDKDHEIDCTCNFCLEKYHFNEDELNELYNEALKKGK